MNFGDFCKYFSTFKSSQLSVSKLGFLLLYPFRTKNHNAIPILLLTLKLKPYRFGIGVVLESGVKLAFSVQNEQSEKKKPKFNTLKGEFLNIRKYLQKLRKFRKSK
jgi:hypothetical protein